MRPVRTVVVDDHPLFRLGLEVVLRRAPEIELVGQAANAEEAMQLAEDVAFDVALVDVLMPGESGAGLTTRLAQRRPECKILGLSMLAEPARIAAMLLAGAAGYVVKTQPIEQLFGAIRTVAAGIRYLPPDVSPERIDFLTRTESPLDRLTRRERQIVELLVRGETNVEIAAALAISERTVETHRQRILKKLGAHSIVEVIAIAARCGVSISRV